MMLPKLPDNQLEEQQKKAYMKAWFNIFYLITGTIKAIVFGICIVLLYTVLKDAIDLPSGQSPTKYATNYVAPEEDWDKVENGIHLETGLVHTPDFSIIRANCTVCHSGKLIAQNRATREGWRQMIRWMQETQGLWDLGKNEPVILNYLAKHYAPEDVGRRSNLEMANVEWYILNLEEE